MTEVVGSLGIRNEHGNFGGGDSLLVLEADDEALGLVVSGGDSDNGFGHGDDVYLVALTSS